MSTNKKNSQNVQNLFGAAQQEGLLSPQSAALVTVPDMGAQVQAALGVSLDDITTSEVVLVSALVDDSGSIEMAGNTDAVVKGMNIITDALLGSKQKNNVLAHCRYLNGKILYPYVPIDQAERLTHKNYGANGGTPLYDQTAVMLATVLAKTQECADAGVPCRSVTVIITDGADVHSRTYHAPERIAPIVADLRRTEQHLVIAMGISDGVTDFVDIFTRMGIAREWILTPANSESEIRKAFQVVSQSAVRVSQAAPQLLSQVLAGGFTN